jgi:CheY-like chemotaxis protein
LPVAPTLRARGRHPDARVVPAPDEFRLDGHTVVIVDDQLDARELLQALLEARGASVVPCDAANAALDVLGRVDADLLVADIAMPEVDGYELIRCMRRQRRGVPAIALSAYARSEDRERALAAGYDGYCAKPIDCDGLFEVIRAVIANAPGAPGRPASAASPAPL